jgi:hypothetical protein
VLHCVEASHWQEAIKTVRVAAGLDPALRNFSIEVMDDGVRAVDPMQRLRYTVQSAHDTAPLTIRATPSAGPPSAAPRPAPAIPTATKPSTEPAPKPPSVPPGLGNAPRPSARPSAEVVPPEEGSAQPGYKLVVRREQDPSKASPLTYRELAFAIPEGSSELEAEQFILERFEELRGALESARPGKLVNLAVFDHTFEKRPARAPLATLVWKDWKGAAPEIRFPSRPGVSIPSPSLGLSRMQSSRPPPRQTTAEGTSRLAASGPAQHETAVAAVGHVTRDASTPRSPPAAILRVDSDRPKPGPPTDGSPSQPASALQPRSVPPGSPPTMQAVPPRPAHATPPVHAPQPVLAPQPPWAQQAPQPMQVPPQQAAPASHRPLAPQVPRARMLTPSVDVIADVFEAMHDLHFLRAPHEGAAFVLTLALDKLHSTLGIVQLYDINHREFVVVSAAGPNGEQLLGSRTAERDPLLVEIMMRSAPFLVDGKLDARVHAGRWRALGGDPTWILACRIAQGGRFLGTIELGTARPDGRYRQTDIDGLTYVAGSLSEFVAARGLVFGDETGRAPR